MRITIVEFAGFSKSLISEESSYFVRFDEEKVVPMAHDKKKRKRKLKAITPVSADDLQQSTPQEVVTLDPYGVDLSSHSTVQVPYKPPADNPPKPPKPTVQNPKPSDNYGVDLSGQAVHVPYTPPAQSSNPLNLHVTPDDVTNPYAQSQDNSTKPTEQTPNQNPQPSSSYEVQSSQDTVHVSCTQSETKKKPEK
jgi:hypothetical protein